MRPLLLVMVVLSACSSSLATGGADGGPRCGDGVVTAPEECDDGVNDGSRGCNGECKFVCVSTDPTRNCGTANPCSTNSTCVDARHLCAGGTQAPDGTSCGTNKLCKSGQCLPIVCGDGHVDPGEQCDPPDGVNCDDQCQKIVCGDGKRAGKEECDDGNTQNLDGCDSTCHFEEAQRANGATMMYGTDSFCTVNALGAAIGSNAQSTIQGEIDTDIDGGTMNIMFAVRGLADPVGADGALQLGAVTGSPYPAPPLTTYSGSKDLDWWYKPDATAIDSSRVPLNLLQAAISVGELQTTAPGRMTLIFPLGSGPVPLQGSGVRIRAQIGAATNPLLNIHAQTPGHEPSERLDPALKSFATMTAGELCGNISALSLATSPVALTLQSSGNVACSENYGTSNHMLDVIVNGCTKLLGSVGIIGKTQPDQVDPAAPAAGAGGPYTFTVSGNAVSGCKDKNGQSQNLQACLAAAAYSSGLQFNSDRIVIR